MYLVPVTRERVHLPAFLSYFHSLIFSWLQIPYLIKFQLILWSIFYKRPQNNQRSPQSPRPPSWKFWISYWQFISWWFSRHASKKLKYRRRVIGKQRAKVSGCTIFRTRVILQRVSLKIIVFSVETPCWSPSEALQHGGRKPFETSGVYFGSLKTFLLSVELKNIRIGTSLDILVTQN